MLKTFATKLEERQIAALRLLSKQTKISQAELVREAIDRYLKELEKDRKRLEFLRLVDRDLEEDRDAHKRLASL
ncbi:ribbon-helix-helix domain-containing protein [Candidatus Acetothermia bacterium]|jgi:predicted DNA-binding protein|nr:ribbon-helix-helix domain-containing protein [Candidatus Acetothermia bacterium]MCI2431947.1 ribbon-helix-helix domain-containing protein [Candidatus Acetothermia bacterium]MCI2436628.1 ribbon-helix-helix domain-containing protein [Candidatus Acetothermia bacterium]